jgi:hypothetical protein
LRLTRLALRHLPPEEHPNADARGLIQRFKDEFRRRR